MRFMSAEQLFIDTNILVYAHDRDAGDKYRIAKREVRRLWHLPIVPAVSVQVLQEFYVSLLKKEVAAEEAKQVVVDYMKWTVIDNDGSLLLTGIEMQKRWQLSFWDALIVAAAIRAKANVLWSEDLNHGQVYDKVRVVNPLLAA
jgi:predicted nucleic acid-binding protein